MAAASFAQNHGDSVRYARYISREQGGSTMRIRAPLTEAQRTRATAQMRAYRATPEGYAATKEAQRKCLADPAHRDVKRRAHRRWKQTETGKRYEREWSRKKYVAHPLPRLSVEERKARLKESIKRTLAKPRNKERRAFTAWVGHIRRTYGMDVATYEAMAANGCHICGHKPKRRLHVDHCHMSGRVRGLLCDPCNKGLGNFRDDIARFESAIKYLRGVGQ